MDVRTLTGDLNGTTEISATINLPFAPKLVFAHTYAHFITTINGLTGFTTGTYKLADPGMTYTAYFTGLIISGNSYTLSFESTTGGDTNAYSFEVVGFG